nr:MAG TPA: hypothetical protein [Caudoviricetes sp.]
MKSTWPVYHNVLLARRRHLRKFNFYRCNCTRR